MTSGNVDITCLGFLLAAALAMSEVNSKLQFGFFITLVAIFLPALAELHPTFLKKLPSPSAIFVLSLIVIDFFLLHCEQ